MSKSLLELINAPLPEIGFPQLSSVIGNTNQLARQALALANREGKALARYDWRILIKRNTLTSLSSAESYSLPSDIDRFIHNTEWNTTTQTRLFGPVRDDDWQADLSGLTVVSVEDRFQLRADGNSRRLFIRPTPTSTEELSFFYATKNWCMSAGGQRQEIFAADTDLLLLDDYLFELGLKWRLLQAQNRSFQTELAEYTNERGKVLARDGGMMTLRIFGHVEDWSPQANVGEQGFGS